MSTKPTARHTPETRALLASYRIERDLFESKCAQMKKESEAYKTHIKLLIKALQPLADLDRHLSIHSLPAYCSGNLVNLRDAARAAIAKATEAAP